MRGSSCVTQLSGRERGRQTSFKKTKKCMWIDLRVNNCPFLPPIWFSHGHFSHHLKFVICQKSALVQFSQNNCCPRAATAALSWEWLLSAQHLRLKSVARTGRPWPRPWPLRRALRRPSQLLQPQRNRLRRLALPRLSACRRPAPHSSAGRCTSLPAPTRSSSLRRARCVCRLTGLPQWRLPTRPSWTTSTAGARS